MSLNTVQGVSQVEGQEGSMSVGKHKGKINVTSSVGHVMRQEAGTTLLETRH